MIIDLITLEKPPHSFEHTLAPDEIDLESEPVNLKSNVRIEAAITMQITQTDIEGKIFSAVELDCTRCLQKIEQMLDFPFEAVFVTEENYTRAEAELNAQDLDVSIFDGAKIDLSGLVREQIILNLPAQIFCSENCKGLCQKCGVNRNLINCNCEEKEIDPRWAALKNLK
jgi:uncharacterized protein